MDYKVYLDYTMELLSKIKIPSYIIDTPFLWDDRYDGELRKTILSDAFLINHKETFQNFINCSGKNNTILLIHDSFACDYIYIKLPDSKKAFFAGPFYLKSLPIKELMIYVHTIQYHQNSLILCSFIMPHSRYLQMNDV
jgi:hypothetical protein